MLELRYKVVVAAALGLVASLSLGACTSEPAPTSSASSVPSATQAPAFPTTLVFAGGEVTLDSLPERVVTIGAEQTDAVLALGVLPVGVEKSFVAPWRDEAVAAIGGDAPVILSPTSAYGIEGSSGADVEALTPDVILADLMYCVYDCDAERTGEFYDSLDDAAPTVRPITAAIAPEGYESATAWREAFMQAGQALGQTDEAQAQLDSIDKSLADASAAHPEFAGKTIAVLGSGEGAAGLLTASAPFSALLAELGFIPVDVSTIEFDSTDEYAPRVYLNYDQVAQLDVDIIVTNGEQGDGTTTSTAVSKSPTAANGAVFYRGNTEPSYWGVAQPTALSVPWALEDFVANLAGALK